MTITSNEHDHDLVELTAALKVVARGIRADETALLVDEL
jgi:hypothetical protein